MGSHLITAIACGNAEGRVILAHLIIPWKTEKKLHGFDLESIDSRSQLKGANFSVSDIGWTKDGIGKLWFTQTFLPSIDPERPQLLVCDGHNSHNNVEFLTFARDDNIIIDELPNKTRIKPLKNARDNQVDNFAYASGITVSHGQFLRIFGRAWENALRECSGSVVECLTRDREAAGSSLTGVTVLWSLSKTHLS